MVSLLDRALFEDLVRHGVASVETFRADQSVPLRQMMQASIQESAVVLVWKGTFILSSLASDSSVSTPRGGLRSRSHWGAGSPLSANRLQLTGSSPRQLTDGDVICGFDNFFRTLCEIAIEKLPETEETAQPWHLACRAVRGGSVLKISAQALAKHLLEHPASGRVLLHMLRATTSAALHLKASVFAAERKPNEPKTNGLLTPTGRDRFLRASVESISAECSSSDARPKSLLTPTPRDSFLRLSVEGAVPPRHCDLLDGAGEPDVSSFRRSLVYLGWPMEASQTELDEAQEFDEKPGPNPGGAALLITYGSVRQAKPLSHFSGTHMFVDEDTLYGSGSGETHLHGYPTLTAHAGEIYGVDALLLGTAQPREFKSDVISSDVEGAWITLNTLEALMCEHRKQAVSVALVLLHSLAATYERLGLGDLGKPRDAIAALTSPSRTDFVRLRTGEILFESGTHSDGLHILLSGALAAVSNAGDDLSRAVTDTVSSASRPVIGEISFISGAPRTRTLKVSEPSEVIFIPAALVWSLLDRFPVLMKRLIFKSFLPRIKTMYLLSRLVPRTSDGISLPGADTVCSPMASSHLSSVQGLHGLPESRRPSDAVAMSKPDGGVVPGALQIRTPSTASRVRWSTTRAVEMSAARQRPKSGSGTHRNRSLRHSHAAPVAPYRFDVGPLNLERRPSSAERTRTNASLASSLADNAVADTAAELAHSHGARSRPLKRLARMLRSALALLVWSRWRMRELLGKAMPWVGGSALSALVHAFDINIFAAGALAFQVGQPCVGAYAVLKGGLDIYPERAAHEAQHRSGQWLPDGLCDIGALLFPGLNHVVSARASACVGDAAHGATFSRKVTVLAWLSVSAYLRVAAEHPIVEFAFLRDLVRTNQTTFAMLADLEMVTLGHRQPLYSKSDPMHHIYLVCSGRIEVSGSEQKRVLKRKGDVVGMRFALIGAAAQDDAIATRTTELIRIPVAAFTRLMEYDHAVFRQTLARLLAETEAEANGDSGSCGTANTQGVMLMPMHPAAEALVPEFARKLKLALEQQGRVLIVDTALVERFSVSRTDRRELSVFLDHLEDRADYLVYVPDEEGTVWWDACTTHSDLILKLVTPSWREEQLQPLHAPAAPPQPRRRSVLSIDAIMSRTAIEKKKQFNTKSLPEPVAPSEPANPMQAEKEALLVLIHPDDAVPPKNTRAALDRFGCKDHRHVVWDLDASFGRLARLISGTSVGIALSGGGSRCAAHIGMMQSLLESDIPIDYICGTSGGAFIGAAAAMHIGTREQYKVRRVPCANGQDLSGDGNLNKLRQLWVQQFKPSAFLLDVLSNRKGFYTSLVSGERTARALQQYYNGMCIEDLWLPFFCNSVNLSKPGETFWHHSGPIWIAVRASGSVPGMLPAVIHKAGQQTDVLIDGGMLNNMPADRLRQVLGNRATIIGSDVGGRGVISSIADVSEAFRPPLTDIVLDMMAVGSNGHVDRAARACDFLLEITTDISPADALAIMPYFSDAAYHCMLDELARWKPRCRFGSPIASTHSDVRACATHPSILRLREWHFPPFLSCSA